ncbi:uncharacterized protein LOC119766601 [Culex quinquefasciatus]|uniref:uncharacterized protein LOC119766601 n=1 Tax=Culex quinquefasciatus TaxID=7176 RepID=UPI0018E31B2D|nr:uncharacterized protein LOC119766601 [Culex quinquefasciatus]
MTVKNCHLFVSFVYKLSPLQYFSSLRNFFHLRNRSSQQPSPQSTSNLCKKPSADLRSDPELPTRPSTASDLRFHRRSIRRCGFAPVVPNASTRSMPSGRETCTATVTSRTGWRTRKTRTCAGSARRRMAGRRWSSYFRAAAGA